MLLALLALYPPQPAAAQPKPAAFHLQEASIDSIHAAMKAGRLSCVQLVQGYLDRIAAYNKNGPALNAIQNADPDVLKKAAALDARYRASHAFTGPLYCIPMIVKDDVNTNFMPATQGSASCSSDFVPAKNATIIDRLMAAGAIIIGKATMGEFAQGYSGTAFGDCHNAYDPKRSPSGSSCGTGVGIAANFATVGIGEDTEGSIRGPASHESLVGLRPTVPLVSRAGMMPFAPTRDTLGPIAAQRAADAWPKCWTSSPGYDPADPLTAESYGHVPKTYTAFLTPNGLEDPPHRNPAHADEPRHRHQCARLQGHPGGR